MCKLNNETLIEQYQLETDKAKKKKLLDTLFKKNAKLVNREVGKTPYIYWGTYEDTLQEISSIFIKCANKFDTTKKIKFSTYFVTACGFERNNIKRKYLKNNNNFFNIELEDIIGHDTIYDLDNMIDDERDSKRATVKLLQLYNEGKITDLQFGTVALKFGLFGCKQRTRKEIADSRGCTVQNVDALYKKAVSVVKDSLQEERLEKEIKNNG